MEEYDGGSVAPSSIGDDESEDVGVCARGAVGCRLLSPSRTDSGRVQVPVDLEKSGDGVCVEISFLVLMSFSLISIWCSGLCGGDCILCVVVIVCMDVS